MSNDDSVYVRDVILIKRIESKLGRLLSDLELDAIAHGEMVEFTNGAGEYVATEVPLYKHPHDLFGLSTYVERSSFLIQIDEMVHDGKK